MDWRMHSLEISSVIPDMWLYTSEMDRLSMRRHPRPELLYPMQATDRSCRSEEYSDYRKLSNPSGAVCAGFVMQDNLRNCPTEIYCSAINDICNFVEDVQKGFLDVLSRNRIRKKISTF